jgi:hypothetical protein
MVLGAIVLASGSLGGVTKIVCALRSSRSAVSLEPLLVGVSQVMIAALFAGMLVLPPYGAVSPALVAPPRVPVAASGVLMLSIGLTLYVVLRRRLRLPVRSRADPGIASSDMQSDDDAMAEIRALRREDTAISDAAEERAGRRGADPGGGIDAVGVELLRKLGIDEVP